MTSDTSMNLSSNMVTVLPGNMSGVMDKQDVSSVSTVDIIVVVVQFALSAFIITGNILTILAVRRTPRLHTVANRYVVSLAVADLLAGLVLPFYATKVLPGVNAAFNSNKFLCLSSFVVLIISAGNSMVTMVQIAVDRLIYIAFPLRYGRVVTPFKASIVIASSWVFAVVIGTMPLYYNAWEEAGSCELFEVIPDLFQMVIQFGIFVISCLVSGICYMVIFVISYRQRKSLVDLQRIRKASCESRGTVEIRNAFRREWPMIKMFVLVFGVFFVCWCPSMVGIILGNTVGISPTIMNILVALCLLNSGMNFIIYGVKNRDFRRAYIRLLCGHRLDSLSNMNSSLRSGSNNGFLLK